MAGAIHLPRASFYVPRASFFLPIASFRLPWEGLRPKRCNSFFRGATPSSEVGLVNVHSRDPPLDLPRIDVVVTCNCYCLCRCCYCYCLNWRHAAAPLAQWEAAPTGWGLMSGAVTIKRWWRRPYVWMRMNGAVTRLNRIVAKASDGQRYPCPAWVGCAWSWGRAGQRPRRGRWPMLSHIWGIFSFSSSSFSSWDQASWLGFGPWGWDLSL